MNSACVKLVPRLTAYRMNAKYGSRVVTASRTAGRISGNQPDSRQRRGGEEGARAGNPLRRVPEDLPVPFDEQLVQKFEALPAARDGRVRRNLLLARLLHEPRRRAGVHPAVQAAEQFPVDSAVIAKGQHTLDRVFPQREAGQKDRHGRGRGQREAEGRRQIGGAQQQGDGGPDVLRELVFVVPEAALFIIPQRDGPRRTASSPRCTAAAAGKTTAAGRWPRRTKPQTAETRRRPSRSGSRS